MKILLLTLYYPPDRAVGGLRAAKVADALRRAGHEVLVVAAGARDEDPAVVRVTPLPGLRDLYGWLRDLTVGEKRRRKTQSAPRDPEESTVGGDPAVPFWKRWIFSFVWLPDDRQGFVLPAIRAGRRAFDGPPDLIYTTAPPFSVHLAGLLLKALTGVPWVAEFRDPWTTNPWKPPHLRSAVSDRIERGMESVCLGSADLVVAVSEGIRDRLSETGTTTPLLTVRNGIAELSRSLEPHPEAEPGPFTIVHAGSFYHARNPFPFLEAVARHVEERSLGPERLRVRLIGSTKTYEDRSIQSFVREIGLERHVRLEDWMPPEEALAAVRSADALFLLAIDQPDQVPNKLYEYLGARRPILAVADAGGETARMLERVGGHAVVERNEAAPIRLALDTLWQNRPSGPVGDARTLETWLTTTQMRRLVDALARFGS